MKLIILDRDGVINQDRDDFVKSVDEFQMIEGSAAAIARLNQAGYSVVVATNQSGYARGKFTLADLNAMHAKMHHLVEDAGGKIDAVFFCPHAPEDECTCRKPAPGLFNQIAERYSTCLEGVPVVGDSLRDLQAGAAVGCEPHLVLTGKGEATLAKGTLLPSTKVHESLASFADFLLT